MKVFFGVLMYAAVFVACNNNNDEKKAKNTSPKDSGTTFQNDSIPESVFKDSVATLPTNESVLLKFNLPKGKTFAYKMNFDMTRQEGERKASNIMKWNYEMKVLDKKGGIRSIQTTYRQIEMAMNMGEMKMEFSSEKEVDAGNFMQMPSRMFKAIKGKSFMMEVNERGEILSVSGFDKIGEAMANEMNLP